MAVTKKSWGEMAELYTVSGKDIEITVSNLGGIITSIKVPDKNGALGEVCLGYDTAEEYLKDDAYVGSMVGRYANRIAGGRFVLNGTEYRLDQNEAGNHLHGGGVWNKKLWQVGEVRDNGILLKYHSPDGECGYPGNLDAEVLICLEGSGVVMDFKAVSDKDTFVSLTNHAYFNLRGAGLGDVLSHEIKINARKYTPVGEELLPVGTMERVSGTKFDFTDFRGIEHPDYDMNFVLEDGSPAAEVRESVSGRVLKVITDMPCVQFYAGGMMSERKGRGSDVYKKNSGFCLEPQYFPNKPNVPGFPGGPLPAGDVYRHKIVFEFGVF